MSLPKSTPERTLNHDNLRASRTPLSGDGELRNLCHEVDLDSICGQLGGITDDCLNIRGAVMEFERLLILPALEEVEDGGVGAVDVEVVEEAVLFL